MERRDPELSPEQDFYRHPELYDLEYEGLVEDMGHYLRLAKGLERVMELCSIACARVCAPSRACA